MALDLKQVEKSGRKIRKLLKRMSAQPRPEEIHDFRTNSRQVEAALQAFGLDSARTGRSVLKPLSRMRKRAGKIRDMDVLTNYATNIRHEDSEKDCAVQLLEFLGAQRHKHAKKFHSLSQHEGSRLRKRLKQSQKKLTRRAAQAQSKGSPNAEVPALALEIGSDLASVPRLNHGNLHPFRLKVKELRNVLKLGDASDQALMDALGQTKDAIGEWHDWEELVAIAERVLEHGAQCRLIRQLKEITAKKFQMALTQAEQLRKRYFGAGKKKARGSRPASPAEPVRSAALKLVA
jgi:CHAD domain-containing protein